MAKKVTIEGSNLLSNLSDDWGGKNNTQSAQTVYGQSVPAGAEWGMNRGEVERFIKQQFGTKVGDFRWDRPVNSNFYYLLMFATKADATAWDNNHSLTNYIERLQLPISAVQSDSYTATLATSKSGSTVSAPFIIQRGDDWIVPVRLNAWHIIAATSQQEFIAATTTLLVDRSTDGTNWTQIASFPISTTESTTGYPNEVNVGPSIDTGSDGQYQIRLRVNAIPYVDGEGNPATMGAQPIIIHVKAVTLKVTIADSEWQLPKYVNDGATTLPQINFTLSGQVSKTLHVKITNAVGYYTYEKTFEGITAIGSYGISPYDSSGTMGICNSGVHEIKAWLTCDDNDGGTLTSQVITHQIMVVNAGQQSAALHKYVLIQGLATSVDNFVQTNICDYMVWNPKLVEGQVINDTSESVQVRFLVADENVLSGNYKTYLAQPVTVIPGEKNTLMGTMEVESDTASDTYNAYLHALDQQGTSLLQQVLFLSIDNTAGFQPVSGSIFLLNPKNRNNGELNPQTIINEKATGQERTVASTWTNFKMDDSDGYTTDEDGNKVLRVPAGRKLAISYNPFAYFYNAPLASKAMTIDITFKVKNVTNEEDPLFRIAEYQNESDYWLGLMMHPMDGTMVSVLSGGTAGETDFRWSENRLQHLSVVIIPNVVPNEFEDLSYNPNDVAKINNTINLVRVSINGVIIRELKYTPGNATEFCTGALSNGGIIIGQEGESGRNSGADIDIHSIRIWQSGLKPNQVLQNYISVLPDSNEKRRIKAENDILQDDNSGRLALAKCKAAGKNVMVWHGDLPLIDNDSKKGWVEIHRYDYNGNYLPQFSGTFCKATKNLKAKGQGTTAMTYYYWNMQVKLQDVEDTITLTPAQIHSSIVLGTPVSDGEGGYKVPIYGGCLGSDFPIGNGTKDYPCTVDGSGNVATVTLPDGWIDGNGLYRGSCWQPNVNKPLSQKLVLKINYASSMQSHVIGVNWMYNTLHTAICGPNSLQQGTPTEYKAEVAKQLEPMLLFTADKNVEDVTTTEGSAIYQGPGGFGPGKMDKPTWGYCSGYSGHAYFAMFEGAANNTVLSDFLAPWDDTDHFDAQGDLIQRAKVKYFLQDPVSPGTAKDPESFYYRHTSLREVEGETQMIEVDQWEKGIGFDGGKTGRTQADGLLYNSNSCDNPSKAPKANITSVLRNASDYVYLHNPNINLYRGTFTDFQNQTFTEWQMKQKWVCRANSADADNYLVKRYDFTERRWVDAGLWDTEGNYVSGYSGQKDGIPAYRKIDIRYTLDGTGYSDMNWDSMTPAEQADHAAVLAKYIQLLVADAYPTDNHAGISAYFKVSSLKFHYSFINLFIAGTDNCSKNTYYVIDPSTHLIELHQDDVDTVLATDNYGYQTKPYYVDRKHPYPDGSDVSTYDGMQNGLFDLAEAMWLEDGSHTIATTLGQVLGGIASLTEGVGSTESDAVTGAWKALNRYLFDIQRYIPKVAYNEAARIRYEFPAAMGYTGREGQAKPLAQSMGDQLEAEIQFLTRRLIYMASYAGFGEFSPSIGTGRQSIGINDMGTIFSIPVTVLPNGSSPSYVFKVKPHQYLYPCFYKESQSFLTYHRTAPNEEYEYAINGLSANDYPIVLPGLNYYRSIGNVGDMSGAGENFTLDLAGSRLTEFKAEPTLYYPTSGNPITASAWSALSDTDKDLYKPAFRPVSASVPDSYGATRVRTFSLKGCSTIIHSAAVPLDIRKMTLVESIDLRYAKLSGVRLPSSSVLSAVQLPATLTSLYVNDCPSLSTLNMQGYGSLTQLSVKGCPLLASSSRAFVIGMSQANTVVTRLDIEQINWLSNPITAALVRWILDVGDRGSADLTGQSTLIGSTDPNLNFDDVSRLIRRYGDIRSSSNPLLVEFPSYDITATRMGIAGKKYFSSSELVVDADGSWWEGLSLEVKSGNDVAVADDNGNPVPNVQWTLTAPVDAATYASFPDPYSSRLKVAQMSENTRLTVRATVTTLTRGTFYVEKVIGLWNRIPEVGDYAWTDGQFDNQNDPTKSCAGMVVMRQPFEEDGATKYKLWVLSYLGESSTGISMPASSDSQASADPSFGKSWGLYPDATNVNGFNDAKDGGVYADGLLAAIAEETGTVTTPKTDVFNTPLGDKSSASITINADSYQDSGNLSPVTGDIDFVGGVYVSGNTGDGLGYKQLTTSAELDFATEGENAALKEYADQVLTATLSYLELGSLPVSTAQQLADTAQAIVAKATANGISVPERYRELVYLALRLCLTWSPSLVGGAGITEGDLHESYRIGKWMLPSSGLLARIMNFLYNSSEKNASGARVSGAAPNITYAEQSEGGQASNVAVEAQKPIFANAIARGRTIPIANSSTHWSCSEANRYSARVVDFYTGSTYGYSKYSNYVVRPVTAFIFEP